MNPRKRRNRLRWLFLAILAAVVLFLPGVALRAVLPAFSPFIAIAALLATGSISGLLLGAMPMIMLILWRRRAFCHYACPSGLLLDLCVKGRSPKRWYSRLPALGYWAAGLTFGGALLSLPFFLFLDPIGLLAGMLGGIRPPLSSLRLAYMAGFASIAALNMLFPALWCRRLCPLGGAQDLIADLRSLFRNHTPRDSSVTQHPGGLARRAFLGIGAGLAVALGHRALPAHGGYNPPLRPPGAAPEPLLKALCLRCGSCVRACPAGIIQPETAASDPAGWLTPLIRFDTGSCLDSCNQCGQHCPTGAIAALPLDAKNSTPIGRAAIDQSACLLQVGRECIACVLTCKRKAILEHFDKKTFLVTLSIDTGACNGCGACLHVCPARAIHIENLPA